MIKRVLETVYFGLWLILAGINYVLTGSTHHKGFVALRYYYRLTNGRLNDFVGRVLGLIYPVRTQRLGAMHQANPSQPAPTMPNREADSEAIADPLVLFASRPAPTMPIGVADSEAMADGRDTSDQSGIRRAGRAIFIRLMTPPPVTAATRD